LPLDDCFIPTLTRSNLHRCLQRNGLSVLSKNEDRPREKKKFKDYEIGFVRIDISQVIIANKQKTLFVC